MMKLNFFFLWKLRTKTYHVNYLQRGQEVVKPNQMVRTGNSAGLL